MAEYDYTEAFKTGATTTKDKDPKDKPKGSRLRRGLSSVAKAGKNFIKEHKGQGDPTTTAGTKNSPEAILASKKANTTWDSFEGKYVTQRQQPDVGPIGMDLSPPHTAPERQGRVSLDAAAIARLDAKKPKGKAPADSKGKKIPAAKTEMSAANKDASLAAMRERLDLARDKGVITDVKSGSQRYLNPEDHSEINSSNDPLGEQRFQTAAVDSTAAAMGGSGGIAGHRQEDQGRMGGMDFPAQGGSGGIAGHRQEDQGRMGGMDFPAQGGSGGIAGHRQEDQGRMGVSTPGADPAISSYKQQFGRDPSPEELVRFKQHMSIFNFAAPRP